MHWYTCTNSNRIDTVRMSYNRIILKLLIFKHRSFGIESYCHVATFNWNGAHVRALCIVTFRGGSPTETVYVLCVVSGSMRYRPAGRKEDTPTHLINVLLHNHVMVILLRTWLKMEVNWIEFRLAIRYGLQIFRSITYIYGSYIIYFKNIIIYQFLVSLSNR